ncbi:hypothetical protein Nepgr_023480 [Nepenthes gracilis]|uniref:Uncharacterized protein n=1 Tax=Nepenthes gracilis TaxID=150966 RepID=A0AAD3T245_NEPGR|nr:hypothetical protein Nepgr_023480 [Nepenthes gracilis]
MRGFEPPISTFASYMRGAFGFGGRGSLNWYLSVGGGSRYTPSYGAKQLQDPQDPHESNFDTPNTKLVRFHPIGGTIPSIEVPNKLCFLQRWAWAPHNDAFFSIESKFRISRCKLEETPLHIFH